MLVAPAIVDGGSSLCSDCSDGEATQDTTPLTSSPDSKSSSNGRLRKKATGGSALRSSASTSGSHGQGGRGVSFSEDHGDGQSSKQEQGSDDTRSTHSSESGRGRAARARRSQRCKPSKQTLTVVSSSSKVKSQRGGKKGKFRIFSLFGGAKLAEKNTGSGSNMRQSKVGYATVDDEVDVDIPPPSQAEPDPVMTIFESRNTQRVRFCMEGVDETGAGAGSVAIVADPGGMSGITSHDGNRLTTRGNEKHPNSGGSSSSSSNIGGSGGGSNIKQFMSRALFGSSKNSSSTGSKNLTEEELEREVNELGGGSLIWESAATPTGPEVIHTSTKRGSKQNQLMVSFTEDPKARAVVTKLLTKARKAEHIHFRYEYAVKCYLKALSILKKAKYPDDHPTVTKTVRLLNNAHHVLSSYNNSANIVKMGIKNEDAGELVKALKMYTIAYRIRRDNLSRNHPSLVVLLNMLGSIQIKRGELKEAMQIYELALNDAPVMFSAASEDEDEVSPPVENLLAKSVTYREMGTIYEMWGRLDDALQFFHKSLECVAEWRETVRSDDSSTLPSAPKDAGLCARSSAEVDDTSTQVLAGGSTSTRSSSTRSTTGSLGNFFIENVQPMSSVGDRSVSGSGLEHGEMELVIGGTNKTQNVAGVVSSTSGNVYERLFPNEEDANTKEGRKASDENSHADMDLALTLHQIAQLFRAQGKFARALDAYEVALRGMKTALGKHHPNVAAVLGNIGNLQKEMGDLNAAYKTYQEVLGIESYRLGLSHPDVAITLHNIATIDAARGNYEHSLQLYRKVIGLQKKLFGEDNLSVAVTAACMGDVYEKIGEIGNSIDSFDEAVRIKSAVLGRHSLDVGRLLHKLGKLSFLKKEYLVAESFISRAVLIYRLNKLNEDHEWFVDAYRDTADIDAQLVTGTLDQREI